MKTLWNGRVCLVIGGASGIGRTTAELLEQNGAKVFVADIQETAFPNSSSIQFVRLDVRDHKAIKETIAQIRTEAGSLDAMIYCAVKADWHRVQEQSEEATLATLQVGFEGLVIATKAALPVMLDQGYGRLIFVSSIVSTFHVFPCCAIYCAIKAATDAWVNSLRLDLAETSIDVANIRPSLVTDTGFFSAGVPRQALPRVVDFLPANTPQRVAQTIVDSIAKSNRTYVVPPIYRLLELGYRISPSFVRWLGRLGTSKRLDIECLDEVE